MVELFTEAVWKIPPPINELVPDATFDKPPTATAL